MDENNPRNMNEHLTEHGLSDEEYAAEVANGTIFPAANVDRAEQGARAESREGSRWIGYIALALGILSLFVLPMFFGTAAVITGLFALSGGSRALGGWSIALGLISFMFSLFFGPLMS